MKAIILAAGQGTRLRPFTDDRPKCMVEINGKTIIERQLETMHSCGIRNEDIIVIAGYRGDVLQDRFGSTGISIIVNKEYEDTNMVYSLMCAGEVMKAQEEILVSYGDIIYTPSVLKKVLNSEEVMSIVVDDGWYDYWAQRCGNPLDDAETLMFDKDDYLTEIGQKTTELDKVQSQYIGLMHFRKTGLETMLALAEEARLRSSRKETLWRTSRDYRRMYMTDLLQGLIDEGNRLKAVHIRRGWYEIDDCEDLKLAEAGLM